MQPENENSKSKLVPIAATSAKLIASQNIQAMLDAIDHEEKVKGNDIHNFDTYRHRFVIVGWKGEEAASAKGPPSGMDGQGGGDPGKQGLPTPSPGAMFVNGVAEVQGSTLGQWFGIIEFPHLRCAYEWLRTKAGENFLKRYPNVFVQATFP